MRSKVAGSLIIGVFAGLLGSCAATPQKPVVDIAAIKAQVEGVNEKFNAAVKAGDVDGVVNIYAPDAHMLPANMARADGQDAIRSAWGEVLKTPGFSLTTTQNDITVSEAGDMAVALGTYQSSYKGPKDAPMQDAGKFVAIFKKVGDEWKVAVDTFNSDTPVTPAVASK